MTKSYSIQVGGDTLEGGETRESVSVLDGSILGTYKEADDEGLERILETAKSRAFWKSSRRATNTTSRSTSEG